MVIFHCYVKLPEGKLYRHHAECVDGCWTSIVFLCFEMPKTCRLLCSCLSELPVVSAAQVLALWEAPGSSMTGKRSPCTLPWGGDGVSTCLNIEDSGNSLGLLLSNLVKYIWKEMEKGTFRSPACRSIHNILYDCMRWTSWFADVYGINL